MDFNILKLRKHYQLSKIRKIFDTFSYFVLIVPDHLTLLKKNNQLFFFQVKTNLMRFFLKRHFFETKISLFDLRALLRTTICYFPFKNFDLNSFLQFPIDVHLGLLLFERRLNSVFYFKYSDLLLFQFLQYNSVIQFNSSFTFVLDTFVFFAFFLVLLLLIFFLNLFIFFPFCFFFTFLK